MTARRPSPEWITKAIDAARAAGVTPGTVEIGADGSVRIHAPGAYSPSDAYGEWKRGRKSKGRASGPQEAR